MSDELDPQEFVQRIRQLGEQRDQQDAERVRKLEEEIIQGRSERLARRAERARSLSPDKPTTPQAVRPAAEAPLHEPQQSQEKAPADTPAPAMDPPSQQSARDASLQRLTGSPAQALEDLEPKKPAPSAAALGRSGTLSWQRRPKSVGGSMRRPLSGISTSPDKNTATPPTEPPEPSSPSGPTLSRSQIAQSLGAKDPTWFKQTPDRGIGSAAYRKSQDEVPSDVSSVSARRQLPGLSRDSTAEPEASSPQMESPRSISPSRPSSIRGSAALSNRFSANTSISGGDVEPIAKTRSPLPLLDSQRFATPSAQGSPFDGSEPVGSARSLAMSPTQGRISPERTDRPVSPTKGMGGFVQSAMLKRSDSVNKRWSAQTPQGPSRQNSTLSNRGSVALGGHGLLSKSESRPSSLSRDNSMEPSSRPGSSSNSLSMSKDVASREGTANPEFVKPALPHHNRSKSVASTFSEDNKPQDDTSPPSPSKRWSPTKSSWLERALNKPESPKPTLPPPEQPSWMAEINRKKQERGSVDLGKDHSVHSPPGDGPMSGRASPIKDVQLKPVSVRNTEFRKNEEAPAPAQSSPKPKPLVSPKPSIAIKDEMKPLEEPQNEPEPAHTMGGASKDVPAPAIPKSSLPASQSMKQSPVSSPAAKPKPATPPKKDFRAGLRPRQDTSAGAKKDEISEFQNVFGRLKKTETKNYVAPDILKDNILRGKSGLAITGGPKPSARRDEFKESLISKKAAMLAKAQETGSAAHKKPESPAKPTTTPEAIAKRTLLGRSDSISKVPPPKEPATSSTPEAISRQKSLRASKPALSGNQALPAPTPSSKESSMSGKLADRFNPALAGLLARGPPAMTAAPTTSGDSSTASTTRPAEVEKGPAPELTHMTKGRARGPKRRAPGAKQANPESEKTEAPRKAPSTTAVPLDHAEDVLPKKDNSPKAEERIDVAAARSTPARETLKAKPTTPIKSPELFRKYEKPQSPEVPRKIGSPNLERKTSAEVKEPLINKPTRTEPIEPVKPSGPSPKPSSGSSSRPLPTPPPKSDFQKEPPLALKEIPAPNVDAQPIKQTQSPEKPSFSVKSATTVWSRQADSPTPVPATAKPPVKLPTKADEQRAMEDAGLIRPEETAQPKPQAPKPKPVGLGLGSLGGWGGLVRSRESSPAKPTSSKPFPISPPASGDRPQSEPFKPSSKPGTAEELLAEFFDERPVTGGELPQHIDTIHILKTPPADLGLGEKIRFLRKQIHEITGDGKLVPVPVQEEHVLFQDSMYLCTHVFGDSKGVKTTEVYLWAGNGVAEATLEDVQLFARNIARQNQGKLIILRQGKETPRFFEALGGIVISRRGSRPGSKEYMLCGRRHLGHIAFDEVDFSLKSLCSGFAYIISTESGKVFIWKGRGCSAEEVSGARLIGMDLNLSGELVEIDEGSEPPELFNVFQAAGGTTNPGLQGQRPVIPRSAEHWRYKATSEKYRSRLFKFEQQQGSSGWGQGLQVSSFFAPILRRPSWQSTERPQTPSTPKSPLPPATTKIVEIMPYCQRDLEPEYIYVLDAFFEMYIIVGALSRSQSAAFSTALMFAQEYSILAVSEEDRPFVPVTTIVLEGVPRDMKSVFRFWDDSLIPAAGLMGGKLGRGKSLKIMPLDKAIQATRI